MPAWPTTSSDHHSKSDGAAPQETSNKQDNVDAEVSGAAAPKPPVSDRSSKRTILDSEKFTETKSKTQTKAEKKEMRAQKRVDNHRKVAENERS